MSGSKPPVIIIAALTESYVIGNDTGMPWDVPEEYEQYLSFIHGNTIIMGRRSFEIFGKDLTGTHNIVISRNSEIYPNAIIRSSLKDAVSYARQLPDKIFIAGGASIYNVAIDVADMMFLSIIHGEYQGNRFFPSFDINQWEPPEIVHFERYTFYKYIRKNFPDIQR